MLTKKKKHPSSNPPKMSSASNYTNYLYQVLDSIDVEKWIFSPLTLGSVKKYCSNCRLLLALTWTLLTGCQIDGSWGATKQPLRVFAHHPDWRVLVYIYIYIFHIRAMYRICIHIYIYTVYIGAG